MKIKSLVSLFLTLIILTTRVGYALNVHYCDDKIAKISLAYNSSKCGMESNFDSELNPIDKLINKSFLITPNIFEAEILSEMKINSLENQIEAESNY